jgi:transcriptional antiterminator RfaH
MNGMKQVYKWYVIYTRPNGEKRIFENLKEDNIQCYLPLKRLLRQWSDRKKWIEEPLFRCYLFVRVSNIEFYKVLDMPGVVRYVTFEGQAQTIPDSQMENIKKLVEQQEREVNISRSNLGKGQNVEVISGPFKGIQGEVIKIYDNYRIVIRIEALSCDVYANISKDEIELMKSDEVKPSGVKQNRKSGRHLKELA